MKISFKIDDEVIEGEFSAVKKWNFKSDNGFIKKHFPEGVVSYDKLQTPQQPTAAATATKIWQALDHISRIWDDVFTALNRQDYDKLAELCNLLNTEIAPPYTKYVAAPSMKNTTKLLDYRIEYERNKGNTDFYTPEPLVDIAVYEVKQTYTNQGPDYLTGHEFTELFAKP